MWLFTWKWNIYVDKNSFTCTADKRLMQLTCASSYQLLSDVLLQTKEEAGYHRKCYEQIDQSTARTVWRLVGPGLSGHSFVITCQSNPYKYLQPSSCPITNITPDLLFRNMHNLFTSERICVYLDKHSRMSLYTRDYFVKQISYLSKGVAIVALA